MIRFFWLCSLLLLPARWAQAQAPEAAEPSTAVDSLATVHYQSGYALIQAQNFRNAALEFERAVAADSTYGDAFYALGKAYRYLNEYDNSIKAYETAKRLRLSPLAKGNLSKELASVYDKFARKLYQQRNYQEAIRTCEKALALEANKADMHYIIGLSYSKMGSSEEARKAYAQELQLNPSNAKAYKALGDLQRQSRNYGPAAEAYQKAIAIDSTLSEAWGGWARSQIDNQDLEGALKTLEKAVAVDPKYEEGYLLMGATLNELGRQQDAIDPLRRAVDLEGKNPDAHFRLAEAYYALGDYRNTLDAAQGALQHQKDYHPAEVVLADAYLKMGQKDQARIWYQRALVDSRFKEYCAHQLEELAKPPPP